MSTLGCRDRRGPNQIGTVSLGRHDRPHPPVIPVYASATRAKCTTCARYIEGTRAHASRTESYKNTYEYNNAPDMSSSNEISPSQSLSKNVKVCAISFLSFACVFLEHTTPWHKIAHSNNLVSTLAACLPAHNTAHCASYTTHVGLDSSILRPVQKMLVKLLVILQKCAH